MPQHFTRNAVDLTSAGVVAPDGPAGQVGAGFIWSAAMRAGLTVRNYGFFEDLVPYEAPQSLGGAAVSLMLYVEDVDAVAKQAVAAGAKEVRRGMVSVSLASREKSALLSSVTVWRVMRSCSRPWALSSESWPTCGTRATRRRTSSTSC